MIQSSRLQRGFAAVAAIFLVVLLAAFGAFMVTFSNSQQLSSAQDVQGTRAYWAARAGLEWAIVNIQATPAVCPNPASTPMAGAPANINGYTLVISCTFSTYADAGNTVNIFLVTSNASIGNVGAQGFIERNVSASLER